MTSTDVHAGCTMGELYVRAVKRYPERIALVDADESITYRELGERMTGYAAALFSLGLKTGDAIAQLSTNRIDTVCMIAAASMAGLRYTPLHPLGSEADQKYILDDAEIDCLVVDERAFAERGSNFAKDPDLDLRIISLGQCDFADSIIEIAATVEPLPLKGLGDPGDVGLIMYTGGTTGKPKGVVHTHRSLVMTFLVNMAEFEWPQEIRFLAVTPVSHAALGFIPPVLLRGGVFIMQPGFGPQSFLDAVAEHNITTTFLVPTMIYVLLDHGATASANLSSLETVIYGASPMSPARMLQALEVIGPVFMQLFGQTECPNTITALFKHDHDSKRPELLASCGQPLAGNDVRLLDEDGNEVAQGEVGELCVRGPLVMQGYWKLPDLSAETLRDGWLHTSDLARADENGYLYIVDRAKDMIISGGFNVFPREIEDVLNSHDGVAISCVIGVPDEKWGEAVMGIVVLKPGADVSEEDLITLVKNEKGAVYAPKSVAFAGEIPLTPLGKPDKKVVRQSYWKDAGRQVG